MTDEQIQNEALVEIEKLLRRNGQSLSKFHGMPLPHDDYTGSQINCLIAEKLIYDTTALKSEHAQLFEQLNDEQLNIYSESISSVYSAHGCVFFVYGYGGTGNTFLWKTLSTFIRSKGHVVITVASSGIASLLLQGGRTAHSRFAIPIDVNETSTCSIKIGTELAELIKCTKLIIWDEAPMVHKHCFEAFDRSMKDIMGSVDLSLREKVFGGKSIVLGGDFRQILPVIHKGSRQDTVNAALNSLYIWKSCKVMTLTKNMRLSQPALGQTSTDVEEFSRWVLAVGEGRLGEPNDGECFIDIPEDLILQNSGDPISIVSDAVYKDLPTNCNDLSFFRDRAILCPTNEVVDSVNEYVLNMMRGESRDYMSSDSLCHSDPLNRGDDELYSVEFLNGLRCSGLPNHKLRMKIGMPVMLVRNIDQRTGLCNGTRMQITHMNDHVIEGKIISGGKEGESVYSVVASNTQRPEASFPHATKAIPFIPCFAMTINKSQGQSLHTVAVFLPRPVFKSWSTICCTLAGHSKARTEDSFFGRKWRSDETNA